MKNKFKSNPKARLSSEPEKPSSKSASPPIPKLAGTNPYQQFQSLYDPNIVDEATSRLPKVITARRKMRKASNRLQKLVPDRSLFVAYDDAWSNYQMIREQSHFNFGYEMGLTDGIARSACDSQHDNPFMKSIILAIYKATLQPKANREMIVAGLLEMARALLVTKLNKVHFSLKS
jgi:hypothetical protein